MKRLTILALLCFTGIASAQEYNFWLTDVQPWSDVPATVTTSTSTVSARSYVPGSNTVTYRDITISTPSITAGTNALGDVVGYETHIYGNRYTAWVIDSQYGRYGVGFPYPSQYNYMGTTLQDVNDERFALGWYMTTGANKHSVIYDLTYRVWHELSPAGGSARLTDINKGQVVGYTPTDGFVYTCQGYQYLNVPGATGTVPMNVSDAGLISGTVSGLTEGVYFVAERVTPFAPACELLRDGTQTPWAPPRVKTKAELECDSEGGVFMDVYEKGMKCVDPKDVEDELAKFPGADPAPTDPDPAPDTGGGDAGTLDPSKQAECEDEGGTYLWIADKNKWNCED